MPIGFLQDQKFLEWEQAQMAKVRQVCLSLLVFAASFGSLSAAEPAASATPIAEVDKQQILNVIGGMQAAWNRGDFRGYMDGFMNPGVVFVSGGRFQDGWQGTLDHYIRDYSASRGTLRFYDIQVEILSADAAQLISRFELIRPEHPQYGINTRLMRKVGGRWVIALNHVSAAETPPAPTVQPAR
jgi:ketosteroid isomerase-like protein